MAVKSTQVAADPDYQALAPELKDAVKKVFQGARDLDHEHDQLSEADLDSFHAGNDLEAQAVAFLRAHVNPRPLLAQPGDAKASARQLEASPRLFHRLSSDERLAAAAYHEKPLLETLLKGWSSLSSNDGFAPEDVSKLGEDYALSLERFAAYDLEPALTAYASATIPAFLNLSAGVRQDLIDAVGDHGDGRLGPSKHRAHFVRWYVVPALLALNRAPPSEDARITRRQLVEWLLASPESVLGWMTGKQADEFLTACRNLDELQRQALFDRASSEDQDKFMRQVVVPELGRDQSAPSEKNYRVELQDRCYPWMRAMPLRGLAKELNRSSSMRQAVAGLTLEQQNTLLEGLAGEYPAWSDALTDDHAHVSEQLSARDRAFFCRWVLSSDAHGEAERAILYLRHLLSMDKDLAIAVLVELEVGDPTAVVKLWASGKQWPEIENLRSSLLALQPSERLPFRKLNHLQFWVVGEAITKPKQEVFDIFNAPLPNLITEKLKDYLLDPATTLTDADFALIVGYWPKGNWGWMRKADGSPEGSVFPVSDKTAKSTSETYEEVDLVLAAMRKVKAFYVPDRWVDPKKGLLADIAQIVHLSHRYLSGTAAEQLKLDTELSELYQSWPR